MNEKHKLMKPKDPARIGRQASQRAKKWQSRLSAALLCALLFTVFFPSCKDEDLVPSAGMKADITRADGTLNDGGAGLVRNSDGTWTATRRVPLVGRGRVINNMSEALVSLGTYDAEDVEAYEEAARCLVDTDLTNAFSPSSVLGLDVVLNQIVSIRDLNYTYAEGQKVGVVLQNVGGVLSVDVLGSLWVDTYLDGEKTGDHFAFTISSGLIDVGLGSITGGDATSIYVVEGTAEKPFDEVRLGRNGVNATLFNNLSILYAYVGENPIIPAINVGTDKMDQYKLSYDYFNNKVKAPTETDWTSDPGSVDKLVDDDLTNGTGTVLVNAASVTVDFGRTIPSGSEVGFYTTYFDLLALGIAGTYALEAYNDAEDKVASYSSTNILDVKLGSAGEIWTTMRIPDDCTDCSKLKFIIGGVNVTVGGSATHYAYVREPVVVDVSSYFTLADATVYVPNYRFADPDNPDATVEYKVIGRPSNATEDMGTIEGNLLKNMNVEGDYIVQATYKEGNKDPIICTATITRKAKIKTYCNNPLTNESGKDDEWEAYAVKEEWGISIFGQGYEGLLPALVNEETGDFVTANTATIDLINNRGIVGVKAVNGQKINVNTGGEKKVVRAGFVINRVNEFLELDVLKFMQIKLYDGEQEVENQVAFNNNGVSLGLIGNSGDNSLARISIDTDQQFDRIELWYGGTLGLQIGEDINIYYAFWDEASSECANPGEECMELITNANYGAEAFVNTEGLLTAIDVITGIGNIVDGDSESAASFVKVADVGVKREVEVTFDDIKGGQEIGFIMSDVTALANIELISVMQVFAYNDDQQVGESVSGGGLDVKLLGGGDRSYVSVIPPNDVTINKLKLVLGSGVNALDNFKIYGVFLRPDYDGDGVVDCVEDGLLTDLTSLTVSPEHVCSATELMFTIEGGIENNTYNLVFNNLSYDDVADMRTTARKKGNQLVLDNSNFLASLPTGYYNVTVDQDIDFITEPFSIHPMETTWLGYSADWNDWDNWSNGVPWGCTNVVIPSPNATASTVLGIPEGFNGVASYPDLTKGLSRSEIYDEPYCCNNIYFAPGAELVGQHKLDYGGQVFIDMNLESGYYHLLSMPLEATITGDMFVAANWSVWEQNRATAFGNYFSAINSSDAYTEQRRAPYVYQRLWSSNSKVMNETLSRSGDDYDNTEDPTIESDMLQLTDWSRTFNSVETTYDLAEGFALRVDKDAWQSENDASRQTYHFHFPKSFDTYNYYSTSSDDPVKTVGGMNGKRVGKTGQFMVDIANHSDLKFTLTRESSGNLFLFGNPMMSHIDIQQFLAKNTNVSSVLVYNKNKKEYETIGNGASTSSSITQIAPMEAVFLQTGASAQSLAVELSDAMLVQGNSVSTTAAAPNQLRLTATSRGRSASCVVVPSSVASDDYDAREDATLLVGSEEGSGVAVYTVAGGKALSIQRMNSQKRIPVGFYLKEEGSVSLSFDPQGDAWQGWTLVDSQTGKRYPLDSEISLGTVKSGAGRFYLEAD